jgi:hypothetical protein
MRSCCRGGCSEEEDQKDPTNTRTTMNQREKIAGTKPIRSGFLGEYCEIQVASGHPYLSEEE